MIMRIESKEEYKQIITDIVDELTYEVGFDIVFGGENARKIARGLVAGYQVMDGEPVVSHGATYQGEGVEAIDEALYPTDILLLTEASSIQPDGEHPELWELAAKTLSHDLKEEYLQQQEDGELITEGQTA